MVPAYNKNIQYPKPLTLANSCTKSEAHFRVLGRQGKRYCPTCHHKRKLYKINDGHFQYQDALLNLVDSRESIWSYAKRKLIKFNSVLKKSFCLHLKEREFCFNNS